MRLKFEISSTYLSQCVATLHCFLSTAHNWEAGRMPIYWSLMIDCEINYT